METGKSINLNVNEIQNHDATENNSVIRGGAEGERMYFGNAGKFAHQLDSIKGCIQETADTLNVQINIIDYSSSETIRNTGKREIRRNRTNIDVVIQKLEDSHKLNEEQLYHCIGRSNEKSIIGEVRNQVGNYLKEESQKAEIEKTRNMTPEQLKEYKARKAYENRATGIGKRG